ncbi:protein of unknown function (DUF192) [Rubrobacter radiotolerans]|uniref:DUF192 domain-containing protein n=1 Tax=Rubrobacter radiotolerans TaxID=42256 RepID=A0A023X5Q7_RUBRA|nr:DUF192 domain-containing protein [Rubrobacter radiotolerans]AHY47399.1 protein of unknown function (DUF192) [Rubrobacter radiotolerans]MDX5894802.1 DUF192 domain-containing protein [Rubrobacter radiotolerans]SMC06794.1 hypothetical protein SAMN00767673_2118 [Rubrobacter radiotolerans DSM 5868]
MRGPREQTLAALLFALLVLAGCGGTVPAEPDLTEATGGERAAGACERPRFSEQTPEGVSREPLPVEPVTVRTSDGPVELRAEIADTDATRAQGLMFRESLGERCGMLFVYPSERELSFWMRNTLIPLSIAYIDSEGRIVDLQDMEPLDDEPPNYASAEPAQYALEVNEGFFRENGVRVGDRVELPDSVR